MTITPEDMREMAADLETDHRDIMKWLGAKPDAAKSTSSLAAAMLRAIAAERDALKEALTFYLNDGPWGVNSTDFGAVARRALEGKLSKK